MTPRPEGPDFVGARYGVSAWGGHYAWRNEAERRAAVACVADCLHAAEARIIELEAERDALRADKARLDWIEQESDSLRGLVLDRNGRTARESIDAARAAPKGEGP